MMNEHGAQSQEARGEQQAAIASIVHDMETANEIGDILAGIGPLNDEDCPLNEFERRNVYLVRKEYTRKKRLSRELVEEESRLGARGYAQWVQSKENSDFKSFAPVLEQWVDLQIRRANALEPERAKVGVYNVLLDQYEPELTTEVLDPLFRDLREKLKDLIQRIERAKRNGEGPHDASFLTGEGGRFDIAKQEKLNRQISSDLGFDYSIGRIDVSPHPFSIGIGQKDVRITTHYRDHEFLQGLLGTIHETGHALYEQGLNPDYEDMPVAQAQGMAVHESQSLLYERHIGLSRTFWHRYWPNVVDLFPHLQSVTAEDAYKAVNGIVPHLIRIEDCEVTYPMHIILRYELEKGLFNGTIKIDELPALWNAKVKEYIGLDVPNDKFGVLQDVHWGSGAFGYFPTYLVGQILAAQFYRAARSQIANFDEHMKEGEYSVLKNWLNEKIHSRGSLLNVNELCKTVTGEEISADYLLEHFETKYKEIYPSI